MNSRQVPKGRPLVLKALESIVESDARSELRAEAFEASLSIKPFDDVVQKELSGRLADRKQPDGLRVICVQTLNKSGVLSEATQDLFLKILDNSNESARVRTEAALALGETAAHEPTIMKKLLDLANAKKPSRLSAVCVEALQSICSEMLEQFHAWATKGSPLSIAACLVLAKEYSTRKLEWNTEKIQEVERILMAVGLGHYGNGEPCNHMLQALRSLCDTRACSGEMRLEYVLRDMLRPLAKTVRFAFVFGSTAKNLQSLESDIDLMLIGTLTQRDLSGVIKSAQSLVGREIKPTIYTLEQFAKKHDEENRFVLEVMGEAKLFIEIDQQTRSEEELVNELRSMTQK